jgi:thiosulfate/3-mercaptopyruvate sulfurtransferase
MTPSPQDDPKTLVSTDWLQSICATLTCGCWTQAGICPTPVATRRLNMTPPISPGPGSSTSTKSRTNGPTCPTWPRRRRSSSPACVRWAIGDGHQVVVYDGAGIFSAARVWWTFRLMGKTDVAVLDGGFPKWRAEGREIEDMPPIVRDRHMTVSRQNQLVKDVTQVAHAAKLGEAEILDARSPPGSGARRRSRGRACGRGIFRGRRTFPSPRF